MFTLQSRQLMSTKCRITIGSMIILSIAVVWFFLLFLFVCLGHDNVGFLAGQFKHKLPKISNLSNTFEGHNEDRESDGDDCDESREMEAECLSYQLDQEVIDQRNRDEMQREELRKHQKELEKEQRKADRMEKEQYQRQKILEDFRNTPRERKFNCRILSVRIVFFVCGALLILALILFYSKGVVAFGDSLNDVNYVVNVSMLEPHMLRIFFCVRLNVRLVCVV